MYGKMQESGFIEIIPYLCILTIWVSTLFSSILNPLRVHHGAVATVVDGLMAATIIVN